MRKIKIAVLVGGNSSERDISLISGREVIRNLDKKKYAVNIYDPKSDLIKLAKDKSKIDVVFPVLHGAGGEDGTVQGFLELLKLPYVGSGVLASALAINKEMSKKIYRESGILTPKYQVYHRKDKIEIKKIKFPSVIKPISQGSSVGINIVRTKVSLEKALKEAFSFENRIMIEEYVLGLEVTGAVLGNSKPIALPVIEIIPPEGRFFDREVKYNGSTKEIIPARIDKTSTKMLQEMAIKCHLALGCRGLSRTDMIIRKSNVKSKKSKIYVLETNTIPGMTRESLFPKAAREAGIVFPDLLDCLIELSLEK